MKILAIGLLWITLGVSGAYYGQVHQENKSFNVAHVAMGTLAGPIVWIAVGAVELARGAGCIANCGAKK
jgi:hypothetical protein